MEFQRDVQERHEAGGITTLIIDEAQSLPYELLEEVRLLANIETSTVKLLNLVLVGQPELADRLNEQSLAPAEAADHAAGAAGAAGSAETAAYIAGRLRIAGGNVSEIFTKDAVDGGPRALDRAPAHHQRPLRQRADGRFRGSQTQPVDARIVREVAGDFDFGGTRAVGARTAGMAWAAWRSRPARSGPASRRSDSPAAMLPGDVAPTDPRRARARTARRRLPPRRPRKKRFLFF